MREVFYAAMLSCSAAILGLLLFNPAPVVHPVPPAAASAAREALVLAERAGSGTLLAAR